ncbi:MAG: LLM class flavin-dependent oxidoreductase [Hyphomonadaceae bacterium]|nr:LLM class flavin-dependent oxidoreductase [Hyphomonadaceae bacterium]
MKIGLTLPYMARDYDRARILNWARQIDAGPFDTMSCGERITDYTYEMHTLVSAAAAVTERVRLNPALYVLPMRSAVLTAKEIATLDVIAGGRVSVTVGVGGRPLDYKALGAPFERRHQKLDEQVAELRRVWRGEPLFEGSGEIGPRPPQGDQLPIFAGAMGPKAIARAAKWADGIYAPSMAGDREGHERVFILAREAWANEGRAKPYLIGGFWYSLAPDAQRELFDYAYNYMRYAGEDLARGMASMMVRHTPEAIVEAIENVRAAGADECILVPATAHYDEIDKLANIAAKARL